MKVFEIGALNHRTLADEILIEKKSVPNRRLLLTNGFNFVRRFVLQFFWISIRKTQNKSVLRYFSHKLPKDSEKRWLMTTMSPTSKFKT